MAELKRMTEEEAMKPVRFIFHNQERPTQIHSFLKNNQKICVKDGEEYVMPEHIVRQLETNKKIFYTIKGEAGQPGTITRYDRPRFYVERLPMEVEKKKEGQPEERIDVLNKLNEPKKVKVKAPKKVKVATPAKEKKAEEQNNDMAGTV